MRMKQSNRLDVTSGEIFYMVNFSKLISAIFIICSLSINLISASNQNLVAISDNSLLLLKQSYSIPLDGNPSGSNTQVFSEKPILGNIFSIAPDSERLWSQTKLIFGLGAGVGGALLLMPESFTNWDKSTIGTKYWDNITEGPVRDKDTWAVNYIGHGYFGGVYYQVARKSGYSVGQSFLYSATMSTFYWEYGIEALAEVPSIQDLIITPTIGTLYGEWAYRTEKKIRKTYNNKVLNSKLLGSISLFLLDPVGSFATGINNLTKSDTIKVTSLSVSQQPMHYYTSTSTNHYNHLEEKTMLQISARFAF